MAKKSTTPAAKAWKPRKNIDLPEASRAEPEVEPPAELPAPKAEALPEWVSTLDAKIASLLARVEIGRAHV